MGVQPPPGGQLPWTAAQAWSRQCVRENPFSRVVSPLICWGFLLLNHNLAILADTPASCEQQLMSGQDCAELCPPDALCFCSSGSRWACGVLTFWMVNQLAKASRTKAHKVGGFSNRNLLPVSFEASSPRSRCPFSGLVPYEEVRGFSWPLALSCPGCFLFAFSLYVCLCPRSIRTQVILD